jgi:diguanylate cyclase (GGDEF)-like protein/PAS domain S-box-containing protein
MTRFTPASSISQTLAAGPTAGSVPPRIVLLGVLVAAGLAAFYFLSFPIEHRHPIDIVDVFREAANFLGVLTIGLWARRDIRPLNIGLGLLLAALWMEVMDEFVAEPLWAATHVPAGIVLVAFVLISIGVREAARRRLLAAAEQSRAEEALARSHATLRAVVDGSPDAVWVKDLGGAYLLANQACADQMGVDPAKLVGRRDAELLPAATAERHAATDAEAVQGHLVRYEDSQPADGSRRTFLVSKGLVRDERGEPFGILGIARDISDRKAVEERLAHQATHDALTGLPNRAAFLDRLGRELSRTQRQPRHHLAVLFVDLDGFKDVNDKLGHSAGDELLVAMAGLLPQWIRPGDSVARFGGDEFTVLLQDVDGVGQAVQVAERIIHGLRSAIKTATHGELNVSVSIGVALSSATEPQPEELIRAADTAMYRAKAAGGNRHSVHVAPVLHNQHRAEA